MAERLPTPTSSATAPSAEPGSVPAVANEALGELRHRFKNHMQTIASLVSLQRRGVSGDEAIRALTELRARIEALTSVYLVLDSSAHGEIDLADFLPGAIDRICLILDPQAQHERTVALAPLKVGHDVATILAQVLAELLINALSGGPSNGIGGRLMLSLDKGDDGFAELRVADSGPKMQSVASANLGLAMVSHLAHGLHGSFQQEYRDGCIASLRFPLTIADREG